MTKLETFDSSEKPYISNPIDLVTASFETFKIMALEFLKLIGILVLGVFATSILGIIGLFSIRENGTSIAAIGLLFIWFTALTVLSAYVTYAIIMMTLAAARGLKIAWKDSTPKELKPVLGLFWTSLVVGVVVILGLVAFIIPGIFFMLWYSQSVMIAADQRIYGLKALSLSKIMVKNRLMDTAGVFGLSQLVQLASSLPLLGSGLGLVYSIVTVPQASVRYVQLKNLTDSDRSTIQTNRWNYVMFWAPIILGLLFLGIFLTLIIFGAQAKNS